MKEAYLWKKEGGSVRCALCNHRCLIAEGKRGICMVRENQKGKLYSMVYGKVIAANIDPVEKKPVYHFYPGHRSYSIASVGCNFRCSFCQNWDISQYPRDNRGDIIGRDLTPEQVVEEALRTGCKSISYTYSEPTVWYEFTKDCGELAHRKGLKNIFVSNGFMTHEMIDDAKFLDVARIDLKSFNDDFYRKVCGGRLEPVLDNLKYFKKKGMWIEVVTLLVPKQNDSNEEIRQIAEFISKELGKETPWHLSAFHPDYKMTDSYPTPAETMERAYKIGKEAGLEYIYVGNIQVEDGRDTVCPECGTALIRRAWFDVLENKVKNGKCPKCGHKIAGYF
jgi:pyruvate formate lyase activating enzyme